MMRRALDCCQLKPGGAYNPLLLDAVAVFLSNTAAAPPIWLWESLAAALARTAIGWVVPSAGLIEIQQWWVAQGFGPTNVLDIANQYTETLNDALTLAYGAKAKQLTPIRKPGCHWYGLTDLSPDELRGRTDDYWLPFRPVLNP